MSDDNPLDLPMIADAQVSPAMAVGAIALSMALKYQDSTTVKDGTMYQAMKMENKNFRTVGLEDVFDIAKQIEIHLVTSEKRVAEMLMTSVIDALDSLVDEVDKENKKEEDQGSTAPDSTV